MEHMQPDSNEELQELQLVPFTSRLCAAMRALEMDQPSKLLQDPLAAALAGPKAMEFMKARFAEAGLSGGAGPQGDQARLPPVATIYAAVRARALDDILQEALDEMRVAGLGMQGSSGSSGGGTGIQVVCLGAGMDTRPWRLKFLQGVSWFEVDYPHLLDLKQRLLEKFGAQTVANNTGSSTGEGQQQQQSAGQGAAPVTRQWQYPLQASSWAPVKCDLAHGTNALSESLLSAGFVVKAPSIFIAEGLLMYLSVDEVIGLLRSIATLSPPGTLLLATHIDQHWLDLADGKAAALSQAGAVAGPPAGAYEEASSPVAPSMPAAAAAATGTAAGGAGATAAAAGGAGQAPALLPVDMVEQILLQMKSSLQNLFLPASSQLREEGWKLEGSPSSLEDIARQQYGVQSIWVREWWREQGQDMGCDKGEYVVVLRTLEL